jgi:hypothetical protein
MLPSDALRPIFNAICCDNMHKYLIITNLHYILYRPSQFCVWSASSAKSLVTIVVIKLEANLNDSAIHLLLYTLYWLSGGFVTYIPSHSSVNLNCVYIGFSAFICCVLSNL